MVLPRGWIWIWIAAPISISNFRGARQFTEHMMLCAVRCTMLALSSSMPSFSLLAFLSISCPCSFQLKCDLFTYIPTFLPTYPPTQLPTCLPTCKRLCRPACLYGLPACPPACLLICLPPSLPPPPLPTTHAPIHALQSDAAMKQKQFQQEYLRPFSAEFTELFFRFLTLYQRNKFMMFARIFQVPLECWRSQIS